MHPWLLLSVNTLSIPSQHFAVSSSSTLAGYLGISVCSTENRRSRHDFVAFRGKSPKNSMNADAIKRLRDLSALAQNERDPDKLISIIRSIEQLFESAASAPPLFLDKRVSPDGSSGGTPSEP